MLGDIFEAYCCTIFSRKIEFDFLSMVCIGGLPTVREKGTPQYFSSHTEFSVSMQSQALEVLRANALTNGASLDMYPFHGVEY